VLAGRDGGLRQPADCLEKFLSNRFFGWFGLVVIVSGTAL
jgi:hypothetical protein